MSSTKWRVRVPGKLMIAGEYAVLEPDQHAIVAAVDRFLVVDIERRRENLLTLPDLGLARVTWNKDSPVVFSVSDPRLAYIQNTITIMNQFLIEKGYPRDSFHLTIKSHLDDASGKKYGLGSSAALVVGVVMAIQSMYKIRLSREEIFKLSVIAHLQTQGNGSGADLAASTFGGWLDYSSFQYDWLADRLKKGVDISKLVVTPWPHLKITSIKPPEELEWAVGWTEEVARTGPMVHKIRQVSREHPQEYQSFLIESSQAVNGLAESFFLKDRQKAIASITKNRKALRNLGKVMEVPIETNKLTKLCDIAEAFGSGKSSGAGGGDCGIALVMSEDKRTRLQETWHQEGIQPLDLKVSQRGAFVRRRFYWES